MKRAVSATLRGLLGAAAIFAATIIFADKEPQVALGSAPGMFPASFVDWTGFTPLTAGTNVTFTGTWPNITINASGGGGGTPGGSSGQVEYNNAGAFGGFTLGGDCTLVTSTGIITCTKTNGTSFGTFATQSYVSPPAIGGTTPNTGKFSTLADTALAVAGIVTNDASGNLGTETQITPAQCPAGTSSNLGCVKPDGTTITNSTGAISVAYGTAASTAAQGNDTRITGAAQLATADQTLSGGANLTVFSAGSSSFTVDCGKNPAQYVTNNGAITITAPSNDGECILQIENGASAGAVTWTGFSEGSNTGDALTTTNTNKFQVSITRIHAISHYLITALQ